MYALLALVSLQPAADRAMEGVQGAAVVVEIASGKVAAASGSMTGRMVQPGSTIKPFIAEAAFALQGNLPSLRCDRNLRIGGRSFACSHPVLATGLDISPAIAYSCNSAFAALALTMRPEALAARLADFGFRVEEAQSEDARRLTGLGDGGVRISPRGLAHAYAKLARRHDRRTLEGLTGAVEYGSAQLAAVEGLDVAGKTGTSGVAWFGGWAPAKSPEYAIAVMVDGGRGGGTAAPIAARILQEIAARRAAVSPNPVRVQLFGDKRIVAMEVEDYVDGVLGGEAGGLPAEAMKAVAVTARTYAMVNRGRHRSEGFDFCESTHCQDLRLEGRSGKTRSAVEATWGELVWFGGSPARVYYTGDCGGTSESAGEVWSGIRTPYLKQQSDPACIRRGTTRWRYEMEAEEFAVVRRSASGRAAEVRLEGRLLRFEDFARATGFEARSGLFEFVRAGRRVTLMGRGAGHGVGLCQRGAEARANQGETFRQILEFYFPGTRTGVTAQGLSWRRYSSPKLEVWAVEAPQGLMEPAMRALAAAESRTGFTATVPVRIRLFPSVSSFRDSTGEPGWVAASTAAGTIRLQPLQALTARGSLDAVLLHEFLHVLVSGRARAAMPRWFEEGLVCHLADPSKPATSAEGAEGHIANPPGEREMRGAYEAARSRVKRLVESYGRGAVLGWVERGIPEAIARSKAVQPATAKR
jgi:stage II sporulation protein D